MMVSRKLASPLGCASAASCDGKAQNLVLAHVCVWHKLQPMQMTEGSVCRAQWCCFTCRTMHQHQDVTVRDGQ
jgi:hypothetical protein